MSDQKRNAPPQTLGENIAAVVKDNILTLTIDLAKPGRPSSSGKSLLVASSGGNVRIADVTVGVNIYRKHE